MVVLLTSVAPIKPWGSPLGFRTLPPCPRILILRRQSPELLAPVLLPPSNLLLPSSPCCCRRRNGPGVQIQHLPSALRGPHPPRPPSPLTTAEEWRLPGEEDEPQPPEGYVVSFAHFHERGFAMPAHQFFRGLLDYYQVELQHLTPNGIQHIVAFVTLCEELLAIDLHFDLWRYLFAVNLLKRRVGKQELHAPVGCAGIHLRNNRAGAYPLMRLSTSNKGWHS